MYKPWLRWFRFRFDSLLYINDPEVDFRRFRFFPGRRSLRDRRQVAGHEALVVGLLDGLRDAATLLQELVRGGHRRFSVAKRTTQLRNFSLS